MAEAWLAMCHPSASRAMEPKTTHETISTTMVVRVRAMTAHVRRSLVPWWSDRQQWSWGHWNAVDVPAG